MPEQAGTLFFETGADQIRHQPVSILVGPRSPGGLPVLVHVVSQRARVLKLRRTDRPLATQRGRPFCLPPIRDVVSTLFKRFSKLNSPAHRYPRSTLRPAPRDVDRKTRCQDGFASPFSYDSFIRYNMPVYPGALRETPSTETT
jgi:hypothetical protein